MLFRHIHGIINFTRESIRCHPLCWNYSKIYFAVFIYAFTNQSESTTYMSIDFTWHESWTSVYDTWSWWNKCSQNKTFSYVSAIKTILFQYIYIYIYRNIPYIRLITLKVFYSTKTIVSVNCNKYIHRLLAECINLYFTRKSSTTTFCMSTRLDFTAFQFLD